MSLQNLFVAKLPRNLTDADLLEIFAEFKPTSAKVMLDAATGKSKGFGFVLFAAEEDGGAAYKALNKKSTRSCGHSFSLVIYPSNHDGRSATEASSALYIRNIPITVPQERVEQFLRAFGDLTFIAMREDHYGSPVWVVYAEYQTVEQAKNALNKLHGNNSYFHGSAPILAKFEDTEGAKRERRRRREEAQASGGSVHAPPVMSGCVFPPPRNPGDPGSMDDVTAHTNSLTPAAASSTSLPAQRQAPFSTPGSTQSSLPLSYQAHAANQEALGHYGFRPMPLSYNPMQANPFFPFGTPVDIYGGAAGAFSGPTPNMLHMPPPYTGAMGERMPTVPAPLLQPNQANPAPSLLQARESGGPTLLDPAPPAGYALPMSVPAGSAPGMPVMMSIPASHENRSGSVSASAHGSLLSPSAGAYVLQDGGQQFVLSSNVMNAKPASVSGSLPVDAHFRGNSSATGQSSSHSALVPSAGGDQHHAMESLAAKDMDDFFNPYRVGVERPQAASMPPGLPAASTEDYRYSLFGMQN